MEIKLSTWLPLILFSTLVNVLCHSGSWVSTFKPQDCKRINKSLKIVKEEKKLIMDGSDKYKQRLTMFELRCEAITLSRITRADLTWLWSIYGAKGIAERRARVFGSCRYL